MSFCATHLKLGPPALQDLVEGVRYDVADIIAWLPSLGFDEDKTKAYQKLFRRNAVDGTKLAYLPASPPPSLAPEPSKS